MAWRNVWRHTRRTLVTVAAMGFALLAMIVYTGLVDGYMHGMERNLLDLEMGDVQVFAPGYRKNPSLFSRIEAPDEVLDRLEGAGIPAAARLLGSGLAAAGDASAGITMRGVDPRRDRLVSDVHEHVVVGQWLDPEDPNGVVLGKALARILGVEVGTELVLLSQAADGSMANDLYVVRGILGSIADGVDRGGIYLTAEAYRELMVMPEGAHQIVVRRPDGQALAALASTVSAAAPDLDVQTWRDLAPTLASMLDSMRGAMFAMYIIVYLAIGIVVLNAMLMAVFERVRELGVLKALGMGPLGISRLIFLESAILTGLALVVGGAASLPALWYLSTRGIDLTSLGDMSIAGIAWDPIWRTRVSVDTFVAPMVTMIAIIVLAVVYPALRAALIRPVEAMNHR